MCGFGGTISWNQKISYERLKKAAFSVAFRGPDNTGLRLLDLNFTDRQNEGEVALFFNRLAILDLDPRSNQPFENERYLLLFNGEIYNHKSIKGKLQRKGISFNTSSDTEVLFYALINYGVSIIDQLNGMFSFAFIDKTERRIILARDRVGVKPLVFRLNAAGFSFASEVDSIIRLSDCKPSISYQAINLYLSLQYIPTPYTIWENVFKLPPGSYIEESIDDLRTKESIVPVTYWDAYSEACKPAAETRDIEACLSDSIESQMQADVPLGFFLSSGIDSSLLAALVNVNFGQQKQFDFFTVSFDKQSATEADEYQDASVFLNAFNNKNFNHHALHINPSLIVEELMTMYAYVDEPFGDYATMMNFVISRKAKEHVTVVLSGDGADELFWGYPRYNEWAAHLKKVNASKYSRHMEKLATALPQTLLKEKVLRRYSTHPVGSYLDIVAGIEFDRETLQLSDQWWRSGLDDMTQRNDLPALIDMKTYLPDCMFYKVDRSSMGASLEVRVPYMDNSVISLALQMDHDRKVNSRYATKAPLKELLMRLAPHYKIDLPKRGFSLPLNEWVTNQWRELIFSSVIRDSLSELKLSGMYSRFLEAHYYRGKNRSIEIWRLLNLALWFKTKKEMI